MSGTEDVASQLPQEEKSPEVEVESVINEIFPQQPLEEKISGEVTKIPEGQREASVMSTFKSRIKS